MFKKIFLALIITLTPSLQATNSHTQDLYESKEDNLFDQVSYDSTSSSTTLDTSSNDQPTLNLPPLSNEEQDAITSQLHLYSNQDNIDQIINTLNQQWQTIDSQQLKNSIAYYLITIGHFYLPIIQQKPTTWVTQSLIFDIVQPITPQKQTFYLQSLTLSIDKYQKQTTPPKAQQLLYLIYNYYKKHQPTQPELIHILNHIQQPKLQKQLQKNTTQLQYKYHKKHIQSTIINHKNLPLLDRNTLIEKLLEYLKNKSNPNKLSQKTSIDILLSYLKHEKTASPTCSVIDLIQQQKINYTLLQQAHTYAQRKNMHTISGLHHVLYYIVLRNHLTNYQKKYILQGRINIPLWSLLAKAGNKKKRQALFTKLYSSNTQYLPISYNLLLLLADYNPPFTHYKPITHIILTASPHLWEKKIHEYLIQITFPQSHPLTPKEIIKHIAQSAKKHHTHLDTDQIAITYQKIQQTYLQDSNQHNTLSTPIQKQNPHQIPQKPNPIQDWHEKHISQWAHQYSQKQPPLHETLAIIQRAVKLHAGYKPRPVQLITLLCLLQQKNTSPHIKNPAKADQTQQKNSENNKKPLSKGRLAQVMTGEGKSLIVAMLAIVYALQGHKVDIITTSTELSIPEVSAKKPLYQIFGITVGENSPPDNPSNSPETTHNSAKVYEQHIVYGTPSNFEADLLRTIFFGHEIRKKEIRPFDIVIVDEVDSMFLDERKHSTRIAEHIPGMSALQIPMAAIWNRIIDITDHIIDIQGKHHFITEDFKKQGNDIIFQQPHQTLDECAVPIEDVVAFTKNLANKELKELFRTLTPQEEKAWTAIQNIEKKISNLHEKLTELQSKQPEPKKEIEQTNRKIQQAAQQRQQSTWNQQNYQPFIPLPNYLRTHIQQQLSNWIENALLARYVYKKEHHYDIIQGKITPIDYQNTGVLQKNLVWNKGLSQFLSIKEDLPLQPETVATNYMSNVALFNRYQTIFGLTGTLGTPDNRHFLEKAYRITCIDIPPHKKRTILGNTNHNIPYKYLTPSLCTDHNKYAYSLINSIIQHKQLGQPILIICPTIEKVKIIHNILIKSNIQNITTYTGQQTFNKKQIGPGEIIIATNIAGRGTDIKTTPAAEHNGGLHVCLTFFPPYYRVERQNGGRTARAGKKGTFQIITHIDKPQTPTQLYQQRQQQEAKQMAAAQKDVDSILFKDILFNDFCELLHKIFPDRKQYDNYIARAELEQAWQTRKTYEHKVLDQLKKNPKYDPEKIEQLKKDPDIEAKIFDHFQQSIRKEAKKFFKKDIWNDFVQRKVMPQKPKQWGEAIRKSLEERWGFWLYTIEQDLINEKFDHVRSSFLAFIASVLEDVQTDNLPRNPHYYILEGNTWCSAGLFHQAIQLYDKAIQMEPNTALFARYNKAYCLIKLGKQHLSQAEKILQKAQKTLQNHHKPNLFTLHTLISEKGKKKTISAQVQRQLNIILFIEEQIQAALAEIHYAQRENKEIIIQEHQTLAETIKKRTPKNSSIANPAEIEATCADGLTHLFSLQAINPIPWDKVIAVSIIGISEAIAGGAIIVFSSGAGSSIGYALLQEGIDDLIQSVRTTSTRTFSWQEWGIDKGISLTISIISAGIKHRKKLLSHLSSECKSTYKATQRISKNIAIIRNHGMTKEIATGIKLTAKRIGTSLGKSVAKECINHIADFGIEKFVLHHLQEIIAKLITPKITQAIENNPIIQQALHIDIQNKNNQWQNTFLHLGQSIITGAWSTRLQQWLYNLAQGKQHNQDGSQNKTIHILHRIIRGVGMQQSKKIVHALENTAVGIECFKYTDDFLNELTKKINEQQHNINQQQEYLQAIKQQQRKQNQQPIRETQSDEDDQKEDELQTHLYHPSSNYTLIDSYTTNISQQLKARITQTCIKPITSHYISHGIDQILAKTEKTLNQHIHNYRLKQTLRNSPENIQIQPTSKDKKQAKPKKQENAVDIFIEESTKGEGNLMHLAILAKKYNCCIVIYSPSGERLDLIGSTKGKPIELIYTKPQDKKQGHWAPKNIQEYTKSIQGNNCLFESIAAVINKRNPDSSNVKPQALRQFCTQQFKANRKTLAPCMEAFYVLSTQNPADVYMGAGLINDAIGACIYCEKKWIEFKKNHPELAQALANIKYAAGVGLFVVGVGTGGGGIALKVLGGMAINKLYDYVLDNCQDQINGFKKSIAAFLKQQDSDLTDERANWAADKLVTLLCEGGRMLTQYAAGRAVRVAKQAALKRKAYVKKYFSKKPKNTHKTTTSQPKSQQRTQTTNKQLNNVKTPQPKSQQRPSQTQPWRKSNTYKRKLGSAKEKGKAFSAKVKKQALKENVARHGKPTCEECSIPTKKPKKSVKATKHSPDEWNTDHIVPKSKGGDNTIENAQILCRDCNIQKGNKMPE